jgi:Cse1
LKIIFSRHDPGILDQVKTEICRAVALYADNYSDEFKPFAQQFALAIWSLLTRLNLSPSFDDVRQKKKKFLLNFILNVFLACGNSNEIFINISCTKSSL